MPVRDVEAIAEADRMMTTVRAALPRRRLAAGDPLAGHPPASDLLWPCRIGEVENADDVAAIALEIGRQICVAAVEGEPMHAFALPERDLARLVRPRDVEDAEPQPRARRRCGAA